MWALTLSEHPVPLLQWGTVLGASLAASFTDARSRREAITGDTTPWLVRGVVYAIALLLILYVGTSNVVPFIYFQF